MAPKFITMRNHNVVDIMSNDYSFQLAKIRREVIVKICFIASISLAGGANTWLLFTDLVKSIHTYPEYFNPNGWFFDVPKAISSIMAFAAVGTFGRHAAETIILSSYFCTKDRGVLHLSSNLENLDRGIVPALLLSGIGAFSMGWNSSGTLAILTGASLLGRKIICL